jgi:hypothetical protein
VQIAALRVVGDVAPDVIGASLIGYGSIDIFSVGACKSEVESVTVTALKRAFRVLDVREKGRKAFTQLGRNHMHLCLALQERLRFALRNRTTAHNEAALPCDIKRHG